MKLRNNLAAVLLMCQCGCAHTYFAWSKPLPVEQTEVYPLPSPGLLDWRGSDFSAMGFGNSYDHRSRNEYRRDMEQTARESLREYIRKH